MSSLEYFLVAVAILLLLSVIISKFSDRLGIPALLVFLAIGMLAGSDGPGGIYFDDPALAQSIGILALVIILFSGGLDTEWKSVRPVINQGVVLSTAGVLITAAIVGIFGHLILGLTLLEGLLLGAIVSSTDAAAVFSILRSRQVQLKGALKPILELESGSNDPMAVFLTVGLIQLIQNPQLQLMSLIPVFFQQMILGGMVGYGVGKGSLFLINRVRLGYEGMYPVLAIGMILLTYGVSSIVGANGFLAIYICALVMGREDFLHKRSLLRFFDGLAWLMQIVMFLTLGLLVFPTRLAPVVIPGLAMALILIFVARPLSVMLSLGFSKLSLRRRTFISWVGLRGAVPIILATYPRLAGMEHSDLIFNVVFFVVLTSALFQGTSIPFMAKWLKVASLSEPVQRYPIEYIQVQEWKGSLAETRIRDGSWCIGKAIYELGLPDEYLVVLIARGEDFIIPNGSVILQANDKLLGLSRAAIHQTVEEHLNPATAAASTSKMPPS